MRVCADVYQVTFGKLFATVVSQNNNSVLVKVPTSVTFGTVDIVSLSASRGYIGLLQGYTFNPGTPLSKK